MSVPSPALISYAERSHSPRRVAPVPSVPAVASGSQNDEPAAVWPVLSGWFAVAPLLVEAGVRGAAYKLAHKLLVLGQGEPVVASVDELRRSLGFSEDTLRRAAGELVEVGALEWTRGSGATLSRWRLRVVHRGRSYVLEGSHGLRARGRTGSPYARAVPLGDEDESMSDAPLRVRLLEPVLLVRRSLKMPWQAAGVQVALGKLDELARRRGWAPGVAERHALAMAALPSARTPAALYGEGSWSTMLPASSPAPYRAPTPPAARRPSAADGELELAATATGAAGFAGRADDDEGVEAEVVDVARWVREVKARLARGGQDKAERTAAQASADAKRHAEGMRQARAELDAMRAQAAGTRQGQALESSGASTCDAGRPQPQSSGEVSPAASSSSASCPDSTTATASSRRRAAPSARCAVTMTSSSSSTGVSDIAGGPFVVEGPAVGVLEHLEDAEAVDAGDLAEQLGEAEREGGRDVLGWALADVAGGEGGEQVAQHVLDGEVERGGDDERDAVPDWREARLVDELAGEGDDGGAVHDSGLRPLEQAGVDGVAVQQGDDERAAGADAAAAGVAVERVGELGRYLHVERDAAGAAGAGGDEAGRAEVAVGVDGGAGQGVELELGGLSPVLGGCRRRADGLDGLAGPGGLAGALGGRTRPRGGLRGGLVDDGLDSGGRGSELAEQAVAQAAGSGGAHAATPASASARRELATV